MEWQAHCGCILALGADGEPSAFRVRCAAHGSAEPGDIASESRGREAVRHALAAHVGCEPHEIALEVDRAAGVIRGRHASGAAAACSPLDLAAYVALMPDDRRKDVAARAGNLASLVKG